MLALIVIQALVLCHNEIPGSKTQLRDILASTHAALFFGTPHSGVKGVELLQTLNRLLSVYKRTTNNVLQHLKENSPALENIQSLYTSASRKIEMVLFYEVYETRIFGGKSEMIVPRHSATVTGVGGAKEEGLNADHCEIVKFPDANDANYRAVCSYIKQYVAGSVTAVTRKWSTEDAYRALANAGNISPNGIVLPKPRPAVSRNYVDRPRIQSLITQKLLPAEPVRHQPRCILHGIGGAGKTQLATNWIRENESRFTRVIFIDASSQAQLEKDLEQFIHCLGPEYNKSTWKDAVAYLDGKEKGWLLFLDNADSQDLNLNPYFPSSTEGAVLITTRNSASVGYAPDGEVTVRNLEESEAVKLLHTIANITPQSDTASLEIVRELGMLAVAITQAGTYIRKTRRLDTYLDTFRKHHEELLQEQPHIGSEYNSSTYAAFDLSFKYLPMKTQHFLNLCAFFHHFLIPIALFEQSMGSSFTTHTVLESWPPPESDKAFASKLEELLGSTWDELRFQKLVEPATHASFIDVSSDGLSYTVHPLLQVYIKDRLGKEKNRRYMRMGTQLLLGAIRPVQDNNAQHWQLLPHANSMLRSTQLEDVVHALGFYVFYESLG
ncbi:related to tetratricopeptide repeat domain protein-Neosartorya fischeri [Serendipita indica DSM 11827]|uniref:Related to tetratricopeptide repeat domain protein-Neosartorya fischeri n=1 Tax=Serendipita indica (strain DSM 11827) TaxID=1109443 RepID=G4TY21_SERID|nr:related to tetratricopeptide repeat domain protein-Neosartorya fischeri [Serendipita indica DSM 11827]